MFDFLDHPRWFLWLGAVMVVASIVVVLTRDSSVLVTYAYAATASAAVGVLWGVLDP